MAIKRIHAPLYRKNFYGLKTPTFGGIERPLYKETATQSWAQGDLLYMDSNGTIAIATTSSDALNVPILGFATKAATAVTGTPVHFRPIIPGDVYLMNVFHLTSASAVLAQTDFTEPTRRKGIYMKAGAFSTTDAPLTTNTGSGGFWTVDKNTVAESASVVQAYGALLNCPDRDPDGLLNAITDIHCNVEFMFMNYSINSTDNDPAPKRCLYFGG